MRDEDGRRSSYLALKTDKQKVYNSNIIVALYYTPCPEQRDRQYFGHNFDKFIGPS